MLALLACAPSDAGTILASTLEGSQKSDALAGCRFALDGRLYDIGALAGMTIAVPADIDVGNFAGKAGPEGGSPDTESSLVSALSSGGKLALQKVVQGIFGFSGELRVGVCAAATPPGATAAAPLGECSTGVTAALTSGAPALLKMGMSLKESSRGGGVLASFLRMSGHMDASGMARTLPVGGRRTPRRTPRAL